MIIIHVMVDYHPRWSRNLLDTALEASPVVVLMGARQTGKSTLAEAVVADSSDRLYRTLDDLEARERAASAPAEFVRSAPRLTIDEVQREPDLVLAVKRAVDQDRPRRPGRFLLTGSANLLLMQRISESLAGRATYVSLWPLTRGERLGRGRGGLWGELLATPRDDWYGLVRSRRAPEADWRSEAAAGGYPVPALELSGRQARTLWFDGYVRTYLERDLQDLAIIENLIDFRRLMRATCLRLGSLVNQADLSRDTRIPRTTIHRYLNLLETSYQLVRLEPYSVNRTKRLIKSPKLYWSDTGLALHLAGLEEPTGAHLENLILMDLLAWRDSQVPRPEVLYWRTASGQEVDLVIEQRDRLLPIEVKATKRPARRDIRGLEVFRDEYPDLFVGGLLLHDGDTVEWLADGILGAPWHRVI